MSDSSERKCSSRRCDARVLGRHLGGAALVVPEARAPISPSSASTRSLSAAGSKVVREQLQLVAEAGARRHGTS